MTIKEICKKYHITADTLRYYEKIGLIDPVKKDQRGRRNYQEEDEKRIEFLKCMRSAGVSISAIQQYIMLLNEGSHTSSKRKEILIQQRGILEQKMKDMEETLTYLNYKIDHYDDIMSR